VLVRAAVQRTLGEPLTVETVELDPLADDQVRVAVKASGVCHSDLSALEGVLPFPPPAVLGHEGAGVITEVGGGVTRVRPGQHVILNWANACRRCAFCRAGEPYLCENGVTDSFTMPYARLDGARVYCGFGVGSFAEETQVKERCVVPVGDDVPFEVAALIGCAVVTGVGAVRATARLAPGGSVAVIGCGGVGQSVVMGAKLAGAEQIVAVDHSPERLECARRLGATGTVATGDGSVDEAVRALAGSCGVDTAFEVVGTPATIRLAWELTRRGGTTVVVGAGGVTERVEFTPSELFYDAKTLLGCVYGSADPDRDFAALLEHWRAGELPLADLVTQRIDLDGVNDAFAAMKRGEGVRSVVVAG
jgi:S-(hydroxymethyl)glutathione dehydrogenase/alcohol dehydrogenase